MKRKKSYRFVTYILAILLLFSDMLPCHAAMLASGVSTAAPVVRSVSISPGSAVVSLNSTCSFTATVIGDNNYSREVAWSVSGQTSRNTFIDGNGVLNVSAEETASSLVVKAVSKQDSRYSATALATVQKPSCQVQVKASPDNAGTVTESRTVDYGGSITLEAAAKDGFRFDNWMENNTILSTDAKFTLNNITTPREITAMFTQTRFNLSLSCSPAYSGSVSGQGVYDRGGSATLNAVPIQGYRFVGWSENGNIVYVNPDYTITNIARDMNLVAVFEMEGAVSYTITASASSENGTISPAGQTRVTQGSGIQYTIKPASGYTIGNVYVDGTSVGAVSSYNFHDVKSDHSITAEFTAIPRQEPAAPAPAETSPPENTDTDNDPSPAPDRSQADQENDKQPPQSAAAEKNDLTGALRELNVSVEDAEKLIESGDDRELMEGALKTGDLQVTIRNDFSDTVEETASVSHYENAGVKNFEAALDHILDKDEKMEILRGNRQVTISFLIDRIDGAVPSETIKFFTANKIPAMQIGQYFEVTLTETAQNETRKITELPEELELVLRLPDRLKADNRKFYILRMHTNADGTLEYTELADKDKDADTVTFTTDRFSTYAIAYIDWQPNADTQQESTEAENTTPAQTTGSPGISGAVTSVIAVLAVILAAAASMLILWFIMKKRRA